MQPAEQLSIEEGICIICGGDDVECLEDCTVHKCVDCGHTLTTFMTLEDAIEIVMAMARKMAEADEEINACNVVEDFFVNNLGDN